MGSYLALLLVLLSRLLLLCKERLDPMLESVGISQPCFFE